MAKRFTDTDKYKKPFLRGLQGAYKVLWDYLYHDCNHAGIWIKDFEIAQIYIGNDLPVNEVDALKFFNKGKKRIFEIDNKSKWFIPSFIEFQYGKLNPGNRAHYSVIIILEKYKLYNKGLSTTLQGRKDKDMVKDKVKDKEKDKIILIIEYLNNATGKNYKHTTKSTIKIINTRLKEGFVLEDFYKVIDNKNKDKYFIENDYMKTETLFGNKFESYLNEKPHQKPTEPDTTEELIESKKQSDIEYAEKLKRRGENV